MYIWTTCHPPPFQENPQKSQPDRDREVFYSCLGSCCFGYRAGHTPSRMPRHGGWNKWRCLRWRERCQRCRRHGSGSGRTAESVDDVFWPHLRYKREILFYTKRWKSWSVIHQMLSEKRFFLGPPTEAFSPLGVHVMNLGCMGFKPGNGGANHRLRKARKTLQAIDKARMVLLNLGSLREEKMKELTGHDKKVT